MQPGTRNFLALDTKSRRRNFCKSLAPISTGCCGSGKVLNLDISDRIVVTTPLARHREAITAHEGFLRNERLAERLEVSPTQNGGISCLSGEDVFCYHHAVREHVRTPRTAANCIQCRREP